MCALRPLFVKTSGAARQDAARAWDEGEENRSWETEAEPVDIPEEAGIIKITPEYRAGRELLNSIESVEDFVTEPSKLSHVDPDALYDYLKESGYEVKPLGGGNYQGVPYENGGGYRIHWGGDRILQYHPSNRSHHGGAYFKISSGRTGTVRIYLWTEGE